MMLEKGCRCAAEEQQCGLSGFPVGVVLRPWRKNEGIYAAKRPKSDSNGPKKKGMGMRSRLQQSAE